jgi:hypothetical protein
MDEVWNFLLNNFFDNFFYFYQHSTASTIYLFIILILLHLEIARSEQQFLVLKQLRVKSYTEKLLLNFLGFLCSTYNKKKWINDITVYRAILCRNYTSKKNAAWRSIIENVIVIKLRNWISWISCSTWYITCMTLQHRASLNKWQHTVSVNCEVARGSS